jgi:hypothetical protein
MPRQPMRSPDKEVAGTDGRVADAERKQSGFSQ